MSCHGHEGSLLYPLKHSSLAHDSDELQDRFGDYPGAHCVVDGGVRRIIDFLATEEVRRTLSGLEGRVVFMSEPRRCVPHSIATCTLMCCTHT